ncbi:Ycf51 family protein [Myxosarcina sp. GI1]|uniref:Ycf51 family protein n=1 Tax=Myxosarcina sp. GI1 TaxID=1541065 RepID=UPI0005663749|nr:Ycf51 family protein [Myxosarcina sp. GI1]
MNLPTNIFTYAQWSGILTIVFLLVTIGAFIFGWGYRFRLVGATGFMGVLTAGVFTLGLSLTPKVEIPGAARYTLVYDNGSSLAVVAVPPKIEKSAIEPTLRQAAADLYSYGRTGAGGNNSLLIELRTVIHPEPGVSVPLYLGSAERTLNSRTDDNIKIKSFAQNIAQLPPATANTK